MDRGSDAAGDASGAARRTFLDLDFDPLTMAQVETWIAARTAESPFAYVVTPNVDHIVRLEHASDDVRRAYHDADLLLCDSRILAALGRRCGLDLPVVPGSDLVAQLFDHLLQLGDKVCVIGGSADGAARLRVLRPDLTIDHFDAPMNLRTDRAARQAAACHAAAASARIVLLAVGSPQQELIAHEIAALGTARGTALCIGAAVDFIVGAQRRAPQIVQRAGMEWAWRLARNPRRLARRYLIDDPRIFPLVWRWRQRRG